LITKPIKLKDIVVEFSSRPSLFDEKLITDIKENGLKVPILVEGPDQNGKFYIVDGNRRFKSIESLGYRSIFCTIDSLTDEVSRGLKRLGLHFRSKKKTGYNLEREILFLIDKGLSDVEIAHKVNVAVQTVRRHLKSKSVPLALKKAAEENKVGKDNITRIYTMEQFPQPIHSILILDCLNKKIKTNEVNAIWKLARIPLLQDLNIKSVEHCINLSIEKAVFSNEDAEKTIFLEAIKDKTFKDRREITSYVSCHILTELNNIKSLSLSHFVNQLPFDQRLTILYVLEDLINAYKTFYWSPSPDEKSACKELKKSFS